MSPTSTQFLHLHNRACPLPPPPQCYHSKFFSPPTLPPTVSPLHQFSPFTRAFPSASKHSVSFILKNKQTILLWVLLKLPPYFSGPLCRKIPKRIVYTRCLQFSPLIISLEPTLTILSASPLQKPPLLKVPSHSSSLMDCPCLPGSTL